MGSVVMCLQQYFATLASETGATEFVVVSDNATNSQPTHLGNTSTHPLLQIQEDDAIVLKHRISIDDRLPSCPARYDSQDSFSDVTKVHRNKHSSLAQNSKQAWGPKSSPRLLSKKTAQLLMQRPEPTSKQRSKQRKQPRAFERSVVMGPPKPPVRKESADSLTGSPSYMAKGKVLPC
eukprot:scaffold1170_cov122-Cylindrotheca_fusiformis.AAC.23